MRNRAAWVAIGLCCWMMAVGCGSVGAASAPSAKRADSSGRLDSTTVSQSCPRLVRGQGMIAFAARGQVKLVDLATCQTRVLAHINAIDVRFSVDGRWLAYSRQAGAPGTAYTASAGLFVVSVRGGRERSPLGRGVVAWSWSPRRDRLYGITTGGALVSASPTGARQVITAHLGNRLAAFTALGISPNGQRAVVDRSRCGASAVGELDTIDLATGARTVMLRQPKQPVIFAGFSPDGRGLLFWPDELCSASLAADGMPLQALPATGGTPLTAVRHTLLYPDFLSWCGHRLIAAAGPDRETQTTSRLVASAPPTWRQRTIDPARRLSWVSPSCASSGRVLAAAAGPNHAPVGFGRQHRSIWLLRPDGHPIRQLTSPPASDLSDEAPRFSEDGHWILFVRTRVVTVGMSAISRDTIELTPANGSGSAIPITAFTSDDFSYYDHYGWPDEIAWWSAGRSRPAAPVKECSVSMLSIRELKLRSGDFGETRAFVLTNTDSKTCTVHGVPRLALTANGRTVYTPWQTTASQGTIVRLSPGARASFWLDLLAPEGQLVAGAKQLSVTVPGVLGRLELPLSAPDRAAQQLIVSAIVPGVLHQLPRATDTAPRCHTAGLSLRVRGLNVSAGRSFSVFILRNTTKPTCSLGGVPRLSIVSRSQRPLYSLPQQGSGTPGSTINLRHGGRASFWVQYTDCGEPSAVIPARQDVQIPGMAGTVSAPGYYPPNRPPKCPVVVSAIVGGVLQAAPGFTN